VEATEIAEKIGEVHEAHSAEEDARFRKFTGIYLGVIAMLLAITSLGGSNAMKVMLSANIQASDTYGFYQSRNIRQTLYQLTAEQLERDLLAQPDMPEVARKKTEEAIKRYQARVERYESELLQRATQKLGRDLTPGLERVLSKRIQEAGRRYWDRLINLDERKPVGVEPVVGRDIN